MITAEQCRAASAAAEEKSWHRLISELEEKIRYSAERGNVGVTSPISQAHFIERLAEYFRSAGFHVKTSRFDVEISWAEENPWAPQLFIPVSSGIHEMPQNVVPIRKKWWEVFK